MLDYKTAIEIAIKLMDEVPLKGDDSRARGMIQLQLQNSIPIIEAHNKREAKKKK